jgi:hypothetical protein
MLPSRLLQLVVSLFTSSFCLLQKYQINRKTSSMITSDRRFPSIASEVCLVTDAVSDMPPAVSFGGNPLNSLASIEDSIPSRRVTQLLGAEDVNKSASECLWEVYEPLRFNFVGYSVWLVVGTNYGTYPTIFSFLFYFIYLTYEVQCLVF